MPPAHPAADGPARASRGVYAGVLLVALAAGFQLILKMVLAVLRFLVGKTETTLDDRLLGAVDRFLPWIAMATSLWLAVEAVYPDIILGGKFSESDIYILTMLAIIGLMLSSIADAFLLWYGLELRPRGKKVKDEEAFPFVRNIVKIIIVAIFIVFILQRLGFDTTAIITGLGVGGLAVALALQDTLGNFFAGVHVLVDKPLREDDYIKLENGLEGTVKQIGWRTTRLVTLANNEVIVPNSKLAGSILENYSTPDDRSGVVYGIGVDYKEDIDSVERLIKETLENVAKSNSTMDKGTIWVRFDSFGECSLNFKFGYDVRGYVNRFGALKDVNRALFYAFREKGVDIPFPVRVVYNRNEMEGGMGAHKGETRKKR
jgi:small-conductance mechanosensitive channel